MFRVLRPMIRHRFHVNDVDWEPSGMASFYLLADDADQLPVRAGQRFRLRLCARHGWWRTCEVWLSAAPSRRGLRVTAPAPVSLGDGPRVGTPALLEGPTGGFAADRRGGASALLFAGGSGIVPVRALLEQFAGEGREAFLIYRVRQAAGVAFREELDRLTDSDGIGVIYLVGEEGDGFVTETLSPSGLRRWLPDLEAREGFVSGPPEFVAESRRALRALNLQEDHLCVLGEVRRSPVARRLRHCPGGGVQELG